MDRFLPSYDDPIVSIILLLGIIFIVVVLSYAYSIWSQEKRYSELLEFIKNFNSKECLLDTQNMAFEESMKKPLFLLALAYEKSGDYSKSINIYLYLLKHTKDDSFLKYLGDAYLKAGFLKRAESVFLEFISKHPREVEVLYKLEYIYEKLNEFEKAQDVLDVLKELNQDIKDLELNLRLREITKLVVSNKDRYERLVDLLNNTSNKEWVVLREIFKLEPKKAWRYYKSSYFNKLVDILYKLKKEQIDLDIISQDFYLKQLYYIKGFIDTKPQKSGIFILDLIVSSISCGNKDVDLSFLYICSSCKSLYPIAFLRCPNCHSVFKMNIELKVGETFEKRGYSLQ